MHPVDGVLVHQSLLATLKLRRNIFVLKCFVGEGDSLAGVGAGSGAGAGASSGAGSFGLGPSLIAAARADLVTRFFFGSFLITFAFFTVSFLGTAFTT